MSKQYASNQPQGYKNHIQNIAIVGITGTIGTYVSKYVLQNGKQNLTAITRKGSNTKVPDGVTVKEVDYDEPSTIVDALKGQDILIITLAVTAPPGTHEKLVQAASDAGIQWVIPNEWGSNPPEAAADDSMIGPMKRKERKFIESMPNVSYIGVSCGFWYEFSLAGSPDRYGFDLKNRSLILFDEGEVGMNTSTWDQTGRGVAALLNLKVLPDDESDKSLTLDHFRNDFIHISSFFLTQKDMFASVLRVTETKESDWTITHESSKERYESAKQAVMKGDRQAFSRVLYTRMFYSDAPHDYRSKVDNEKLGLPKEDLDEATKYAIKLDNDGWFEQQYSATIRKS